MNLQQYAETHEVFNQVPPLDGANLYRIDLPLQEWVRRYGGDWAEDRLVEYGALAGGLWQYRTQLRQGREVGLAIFVGAQLVWLGVVLLQNGVLSP